MTTTTTLLLLLLSLFDGVVRGDGTQRNIMVFNDSGRDVEIFWVHPHTKDLTVMTEGGLMAGADMPLSSYVGHTFKVHELPNRNTGACTFKECRKTQFIVTQHNDQLISVTNDFEAKVVDSRVKAQEEARGMLENCQAIVKKGLPADATQEEIAKSMQKLVACVEDGVATTIERSNEEIAFQASVRKGIAAKLENYTCDDSTMDSSQHLRQEVWVDPAGERRLEQAKIASGDSAAYVDAAELSSSSLVGRQRGTTKDIFVMHERPASRINLVKNFIAEDECEAMEAAAQSMLHHATVADGKGGSRLSPNRKAMQAGIRVPWQQEQEGNRIARLSRRVYDYTNHVLGLNIQEHGQEDLMSIQYFGRGLNDTEPDRYTPHCDGDCTGLPLKYGTRMATMVMYCKVPELGGHTNFRNSDVHVKPRSGDAVFFSYVDPQELIMDNGFTEHSGCPVLVGEKKIVTQWIRLGVDGENPWDSFNTLGIKIGDDD